MSFKNTNSLNSVAFLNIIYSKSWLNSITTYCNSVGRLSTFDQFGVSVYSSFRCINNDYILNYIMPRLGLFIDNYRYFHVHPFIFNFMLILNFNVDTFKVFLPLKTKPINKNFAPSPFFLFNRYTSSLEHVVILFQSLSSLYPNISYPTFLNLFNRRVFFSYHVLPIIYRFTLKIHLPVYFFFLPKLTINVV